MKSYTALVAALCIAGCASPVPPPVGTYRYSWTTIDLRQYPPIEEVHAETLEIKADGTLEYSTEPMRRAVGSFRVVGSNALHAAVEVQEVRLSLIGRERKKEWVPRQHETRDFYLDPRARTFSTYPTRGYLRKVGKGRSDSKENTHCCVAGAVKHPGRIECPARTPIESIVSRAGRFTSRANPRHMKIIRDDVHITFDPAAVPEGHVENTLIRPGDLVIVGAFMRWF